ncbi:MAG: glycosyltransferase family 2 protein [Deltaproteobacteria bacterium]|nr:glycosyltransferase family 2 protein [Deltaproteobacteria bacterium]
MPERVELSVVIPAYNEQQRIGQSLDRLRAYCDREHPQYEVLVVDDGSSDRTAELVAERCAGWPALELLRMERNRGKGAATRRGVLRTRGEWVLCSDADLSTPIEYLAPLLAAGEQNEVVIGSRAVAGAQITRRQPVYRVLMGRVFNWVVRALTAPGLQDTQCGFKLFRRDAARAIFSRTAIDGFAFDVEALFIAHRLGYRIAEVPVAWHNDERSKVRLIRDPARMFLDVIAVRWHHRDLG